MKILYDVNPHGANKECQNVLQDNNYIALAICEQEQLIKRGLKYFLYKHQETNLIMVWLRTDEMVVTNIMDEINSILSYRKSEQNGFLNFTLPELVFLADAKSIEYIVKNFNQIASLEIYFLKKNSPNDLLSLLKNHWVKLNTDICKKLLSQCDTILNKSGDEDEIEAIVNKNCALSFIQYFIE